MSKFTDTKAVLLDRMVWDSPEFVVGRVAAAIIDLGINKPCSVCHAKGGEMCVTPSGRDRSVTHTERNQEKP